MLQLIKNKANNLLNFLSRRKREVEDYSTKLNSNYYNIEHLFIYKNERLLRLNNTGTYIWYCCWDKGHSKTSLQFLEFLQFVSRDIPMRVYEVLNIHILISFTVQDMCNIYENYIKYSVNHEIKPNIFIDALLEDISLDIPQSFITGTLNKAIKYHRTTLDGKLDEDFKEIKNHESKFPIQVQPNRYIIEADSIYNIRDQIKYTTNTLNVFVSDEELLLFGHIMLQLNDVYVTVRLAEIWDELPCMLEESEIIKSKEELHEYIMTLASTCMDNDISLIIDDKPKSDIIHPEDSNEELIEEVIIKENKEKGS